MMRKINKIIVHCSAGNINNTAADIVRFHTGPVSKGGRGWKSPGYHFFIEKDGTVVQLVPVEKISNGVVGHNSDSINVCYAGGVDQESWIGGSADIGSRLTPQDLWVLPPVRAYETR